jgi:hypothetical protein
MMGYSSYVTSDGLTFSRTLNAVETRALEAAATENFTYFLTIERTEETVETNDGTLTKVSCESISAVHSTGKAYTLAEDLQRVLRALPTDVTAHGYIERIGEEWPDAERLYVVSQTVVSVIPKITWTAPEGA